MNRIDIKKLVIASRELSRVNWEVRAWSEALVDDPKNKTQYNLDYLSIEAERLGDIAKRIRESIRISKQPTKTKRPQGQKEQTK